MLNEGKKQEIKSELRVDILLVVCFSFDVGSRHGVIGRSSLRDIPVSDNNIVNTGDDHQC